MTEEYLYQDRVLGYAIKLRQLQGVMQQILDSEKELGHQESREMIEEALKNLGLSSDKFMTALLTDVTRGHPQILPMHRL